MVVFSATTKLPVFFGFEFLGGAFISKMSANIDLHSPNEMVTQKRFVSVIIQSES